MEIRKLLPYLFALLLIAGLSACGKDKDKEPTKRDLLTAHTWVGDEIYVYGQNQTALFANELGFNIKDNRVTYKKDGTYTDAIGRMSLNGTWEFTDNEQAILFDKGTADAYTSRVMRLTADEFYIEHILEEEGYDPIPIEFRFKK